MSNKENNKEFPSAQINWDNGIYGNSIENTEIIALLKNIILHI